MSLIFNRNDFAANGRIYAGPSVDETSLWLTSEECVWSGPSWLRVKKRLDTVKKYHELRSFFQLTLGIADATWKDALEELKGMKESSTSNIEIVRDIYRTLWREFEQDESNGASIRYVSPYLTYPNLSR